MHTTEHTSIVQDGQSCSA